MFLAFKLCHTFFLSSLLHLSLGLSIIWSPILFLGICQTLISFGDYHSWIFWFSLVELQCLTPVTVWSKESLLVLIKKTKRYHGRAQKVFFWIFLDPSSPRLASGSPRPWNSFMPKKTACLGELIPSGLSICSLGQASTAPKWLFSYK